MKIIHTAEEIPEEGRDILIMASNRHYFMSNRTNFVGTGHGKKLPDPECRWVYISDIKQLEKKDEETRVH
jgi:hypothetical protein